MATMATVLPQTRRLSGAQLIVHLLEHQGITMICGIPGGTVLPLYDALSESRHIRHVLARHEQGAGFIAQGIARTRDKPAVCVACSGPGATNLITAVADAHMDSVPLVCITGQVPRAMMGTDAFQEVDTYGLSIPITKHNYLVGDVKDLPGVIDEAFSIAQSGRPGPVWIDVPKDVQLAELDYEDVTALISRPELPEISSQSIMDMAAMINLSQRPILYVGGGAAKAEQQVRALAEHGNLPATMTLNGLGILPAKHALSLGMLGMHGSRSTNLIMHDADLLVVLGARFDDRAIGLAEEFCPDAKIIHVDIDPAEIGKIRQPHIAIEGDVADVLTRLLPRIKVNARSDWLATVDEMKQHFPDHRPDIQNPLSHFGVIQAVAECVDGSEIITTDVGQHQMWVAQSYPFNRADQWLTSGGLGTMGFGLPAAIGAALAEPKRKVLCFTGDGSLMMNIQEMATATENDLDVKVILMNNRALGLVHQQQSLFFQKNIYGATYLQKTDFLKIASGFGLHTCDLNMSNDPRTALKQALERPGPGLIQVFIDPEEKVYPMVPAGAANTCMLGE